MTGTLQKFLIDSERVTFDVDHRKKINFNISQCDKAIVKGKRQYVNIELARKRAARIKDKVIGNLDKYLIEFETNFTKRGGKIIWAQDGREAIEKILLVLNKVKAKMVVKGKSMTTEEISFNESLETDNIESVETDLGEYIVQLAGEPPYHIVTPAMHKSKEEVAQLFHEKKGTPIESTPQDIAAFVRKILRKKFRSADAGITGANFLIADIGAIALTENEGNILMSTSFPKIHIAIAGIEKMIPFMKDLDLFWSLLSTNGTGQNITAYNTIFTGPKKEDELDGPREMYVVLLDNGRTKLLGKKEQRKALSCIRCGACLNGCPVYKNIGGHTYGSAYSGPIGSVITPHYKGMEEYKHLSYASSLCGKCTEICPVNMEIHNLLLYNRRDAVKEGLSSRTENWSMYFWKKVMLKRGKMEKGGAKFKNFMLKQLFRKSWGDRREMPKIAAKSFNQLWREKQGNDT
ncbi:MAG: LutB/LldF family L-lactate oxidation iron-sulfur protein [Bacteroidota bacterium]